MTACCCRARYVRRSTPTSADTTNYKAATRVQLVDELIAARVVRHRFPSAEPGPVVQHLQRHLVRERRAAAHPTDRRERSDGAAGRRQRPEARDLATTCHSAWSSTFRLHWQRLDVYSIEVQDRIALSSNFQSTALTNLLAANGFPGIAAVSYETNAVDTTTKGVDLTVTWSHDFGSAGALSATLGGETTTKPEFDRIAGTPAALTALGITAPLFDLTQQVRFTNSMPKDKVCTEPRTGNIVL